MSMFNHTEYSIIFHYIRLQWCVIQPSIGWRVFMLPFEITYWLQYDNQLNIIRELNTKTLFPTYEFL